MTDLFESAAEMAEEQAKGLAIAGLLTGEPVSIPNDPEFKKRLGDVLAILKKGEAA